MGDLNAVLWSRASLVVLLIMFCDGLVSGYGEALMPIAAVKLFSLTTAQWSQLVATMGLAGAFIALGLGPMIDRFGAKTMLLTTVMVVCLHAFMLAGTQQPWTNSSYVLVMLSGWVLMLPVTMVCVIALAMSICCSRVSATQFAVYTSVAQNYALMGALLVVMFCVIAIFRRHESLVLATEQEPAGG